MVGFYDLSDTDNDNDSAILTGPRRSRFGASLRHQLLRLHRRIPSPLPPRNRFRNLKFFPPSKTKALTFSSTNNQSPNLDPSKHNPNEKPEQGSVSSPNFSPSKHNPNEKPDHGSVSVSVSSPPFGSASASSPSSDESSMSSIFKPTQKEQGSKRNSVSEIFEFPFASTEEGLFVVLSQEKKQGELG
ncbi:hypothetical protein GmHk_09G026761 [Glycine max]|nr:hypothetical protein GmHk_09G026761 [Glycine max]